MAIIPTHRTLRYNFFSIILCFCLLFPGAGYSAYQDDCPANKIVTPKDEEKYFNNDREITSTICLGPGTYHYNYVYIHSGGKLIFPDATVDFWAKSILVENDGSLIAGDPENPVGKAGAANAVTIHLYGKDEGTGIKCKTTKGDAAAPDVVCGVRSSPDKNMWQNDHKEKYNLPGGAKDLFYQYKNLPTYDKEKDGDYYFGRKALAVSYGGTLQMFGQKGATYIDPAREAYVTVKKGDVILNIAKFVDWRPGDRIMLLPKDDPFAPSGLHVIKAIDSKAVENKAVITIDAPGVACTDERGGTFLVVPMDPYGISWVRLNAPLDIGKNQLVLNRPVNWQPKDRIVVTTTDYLPAHSEVLTIDKIDSTGTVITTLETARFPHSGKKYSLSDHAIPDRLTQEGFNIKEVDTRAAVALLTRNIAVVSHDCAAYDPVACNTDPMPDKAGVYFGGHTIVRQGFKSFQIQGVEFRQLGQGGRMAHAPVNFHLTRRVPANTFVRDCSVNESMAHWIELRGTQNVILERNVGFKSIGHGYLLADGTEVNNLLRANLGIYARPAADYRDNTRKVPGILSGAQQGVFMRYGSDFVHPTVFHIMNGYNSFEYNMASGAGACGACFWFLPANISGLSGEQTWEGYAAVQKKIPGAAPIKSFKGNFCNTAMHSLITIGGTNVCRGLDTRSGRDNNPGLTAVSNPYTYRDSYLPTIKDEAYLQPTQCAKTPKTPSGQSDGCDSVNSTYDPLPCIKGQTENCVVSVIDTYTSSFHWAQQNFAAIWLRSNWFLLTDSALTDVLNGGLSMISGGTYDQVVNGYWALTRKSAFIGNTQDDNPYATNAGPVNPGNKDPGMSCPDSDASYCLLKDEGIAFPTDNFAVNQRLYNIYDGPVYQETNAFLKIRQTPVNCGTGAQGQCNQSGFMYGPKARGMGIPRAKEGINRGQCILPNAAIGWKQPNGFYYPPAFHSRNLYFNAVDIRHFIIVPLFMPGSSAVDANRVKDEYCTYNGNKPGDLFASNYTDIDRQTELNDDDGTLTGLKGSISINRDRFFEAPVQTMECLAEQSCIQVPYDYVSAVVYPDCAARGNQNCNNTMWTSLCEDRYCHGVPLYRQYMLREADQIVGESILLTKTEAVADPAEIAVVSGLTRNDPAYGGKVSLTIPALAAEKPDYGYLRQIKRKSCTSSVLRELGRLKDDDTVIPLRYVVDWKVNDPVYVQYGDSPKDWEWHTIAQIMRVDPANNNHSTITLSDGLRCSAKNSGDNTCSYLSYQISRIDSSEACIRTMPVSQIVRKDESTMQVVLTGNTDWYGEYPSPEQSIRMMGGDLFQRSSLIANRGAYYIDTTVSQAVQDGDIRRALQVQDSIKESLNVFEKGKSYNVFLLYTKPETRVTFQLYVGKVGFSAENNLRMIRTGLNRTQEGEGKGSQGDPRADNAAVLIKPLNFTTDRQLGVKWPDDKGWARSYDPQSGILTITMDLQGYAAEHDAGLQESCRPTTFCELKTDPATNKKACGYKNQDIIGYKGDDKICQWATKAMECPSGGCFGFQVDLPAAFSADDIDRRPRPVPYTECEKIDPACKFASTWGVNWTYPDDPNFSRDSAMKESAEEHTIASITTDFSNRTTITMDNGVTCAPGDCPYQLMKRVDPGTRKVTGWSWIRKDAALKKGDTMVGLDRIVDWKPGDRIALTTVTKCVYGGTPPNDPPPFPADLWK